MIQSVLDEKDIHLKLRAMRYLWHLGYLVRRNVYLVDYVGERRDIEYTDIDVLGVSFDRIFDKRVVLCDCKSGSSAGSSDRILVLGGLVRSLGAQFGLFVRTTMSEHRFVDFAERINVRALSTDQLDQLERSLGIDPEDFFGPFSLNQERAGLLMNLLKKSDKRAYEYLTVQNWLDPPHQRILTIAAHCSDLKNSELVSDDGKAFLLGYCLAVLGLAVLEFSRQPLHLKQEHREEFVKQNLLGGRLSFYDKRELLSAFYDFMVSEIQKKYGQKYPVPKRQFVDYVIPSYSKYVVDLVSRLCADPSSAVYVPKIIDLITYERILYGNEISLKQVGLHDSDEAKAAITSSNDLITFASRAQLIDGKSEDRFQDALRNLHP